MLKILTLSILLFISIHSSYAINFSDTIWENIPVDNQSKISLKIFSDLSWSMNFQKTGETLTGHKIKCPINYVHKIEFLDLIGKNIKLNLIVRNSDTLYFVGELLYRVED